MKCFGFQWMFLAVRIWWAWCVFVVSLGNPKLCFAGRQQPAEMLSLTPLVILHCTLQSNKSTSSLRNCIKSLPATECLLKLSSPCPLLLLLLLLLLWNYLKIHLLIFFRLVLKLKQLAKNTRLVFVFIPALCYTRQLEQPVAENLTTCWDPSFIYFIFLPTFTSGDVVGWRKLRRSVYCVASAACVFALPESVYSLTHLTCCTFCSDLQPTADFIVSPKAMILQYKKQTAGSLIPDSNPHDSKFQSGLTLFCWFKAAQKGFPAELNSSKLHGPLALWLYQHLIKPQLV